MVRTDQRQLTPFVDFLRLAAYLRAVVLTVVFVLLVRTFLVEGGFVVSGASMLPTLRGSHFKLCCPKCATVFCVEAEDESRILPHKPPLRLGTCPTCAFNRVPVPADTWHTGDRVYVNRVTLSLRAIRRWDVVLFRSPDDGRLTIKRVVGLPGETLEIRNGDIVINDQVAVKPFAVQRAMRIPVLYDRWEVQPGQLPGTFECVWHPIRNAPYSEPLSLTKMDSIPGNPLYGVTNQLCENQWRIEPPGGIFPVRDLMLELDWQPDASKTLGIIACSGECRFDVQFDPSQKSVTISPGETRGQCGFNPGTNGTHKIAISLFDRQLLVAVDGVIVVELPFYGEMQISNDESPFAIRLPGNDALSREEQEAAFARQITNLRVGRDVYYTNQPNDASSASVTIPAGCYYLLGDNSAFSSDSRYWREPFVTQRHLIGILAMPSQRTLIRQRNPLPFYRE
jgi:signal peptidase I